MFNLKLIQMAGVPSAMWTVVILTTDSELHRVYRLCPNTKLSVVMQTWRDDCRLFGHWSFLSVDEKTEYEIDSVTLQMVGEVYPDAAAVTLRAKLSKETRASKIFVYLEGECRHITVSRNQRVRDVMWRLTERPLSFDHEGTPLDPNMTFAQTGLNSNSVVCESRDQVQVKLSCGETRTIAMDAGSLALHLIDKVSFYETKDEFSLKHCGKILELHESVKDLKGVVEVARVEFRVNFKYRRIIFSTKSRSVPFSAFLSQLSDKAQMDRQTLEEMKFYCSGCQRCICKTDGEDDEQVLPINCCKVKSATLMVRPAFETNTQSELETRLKFIQRIYSDLLNNALTEPSREDIKKMKDRLTDAGINYYEGAKWMKKLRKIIGGLECKINSLEEEKRKLLEDFDAKNAELEDGRTKNAELEANIKNHMEEIKTNMEKLREDFTTNNETMKARRINLEENVKKDEEEFQVSMKNNLEDLGANVNSLVDFHSIGPGVKLFVLFPQNHFTPNVSRPEFQSQGQFTGTLHFTRCELGKLRPGWAAFEEVRNMLRPLFTGSEIAKIHQWHSWVEGRTVVWVTSTDDKETTFNLEYLCSLDGRESKGKDVKRDSQYITEGGRVFIANGRRRTVMQIRPS